jgi:thioredoxin
MSEAAIHVACLCAAWCRLCDDYRVVLRAVAAETAGAGRALVWHWIDIEDEAELLGDVDVETFPTLVVAGRDGVRFAGPLTPHADTLRRLLRATVFEVPADTTWPAADHEFAAFMARLMQRSR